MPAVWASANLSWTDTGSRRNFSAGTCHFYCSRPEKEPGNSYRKRNRQQSFQYFLCIRMQCQHHSPSPQRNYQLRFVHTGRFQHSALAVRTVLCQANDYTYRRRYYDTLLCGIYDGTDLQYVIRQTTLKNKRLPAIMSGSLSYLDPKRRIYSTSAIVKTFTPYFPSLEIHQSVSPLAQWIA